MNKTDKVLDKAWGIGIAMIFCGIMILWKIKELGKEVAIGFMSICIVVGTILILGSIYLTKRVNADASLKDRYLAIDVKERVKVIARYFAEFKEYAEGTQCYDKAMEHGNVIIINHEAIENILRQQKNDIGQLVFMLKALKMSVEDMKTETDKLILTIRLIEDSPSMTSTVNKAIYCLSDLSHVLDKIIPIADKQLEEKDALNSDDYPFVIQELNKPNLLLSIFGIKNKSNAIIELTNALAKSTSIRQVAVQTIFDLNEKYKIDIHNVFKEELDKYYSQYIRYCLSDKKLSQEETDNLYHLKKLFCISDKKHKVTYENACKDIYKNTLNDILVASDISASEIEFMKKLQRDLDIPADIADNIYKTEISAFLSGKLINALADNELSPDEEKEFVSGQSICATNGQLKMCHFKMR